MKNENWKYHYKQNVGLGLGSRYNVCKQSRFKFIAKISKNTKHSLKKSMKKEEVKENNYLPRKRKKGYWREISIIQKYNLSIMELKE